LSVYASSLTPLETHGKQIYFYGTSPDGNPITAKVGRHDSRIPGSALPCANCHGSDGLGRAEGGVIPARITWSHLTKSYGHDHPTGRRHPAFAEDTLKVAIRDGKDPAGNQLDTSMPRYTMLPDDQVALLEYLKILETDRDAGISNDKIHLLTLLPLSGNMAPLGQAMAALLNAYFDDLNGRGGLYGRQLDLTVLPLGNSPASTLDALNRILERNEVFAIISPFAIGLEEKLSALIERERIPMVGPFTQQPPHNHAFNRHTFYLYSGLEQQLAVLIEYAAGLKQPGSTAFALIGPETETVTALSDDVRDLVDDLGSTGVQMLLYPDGEFDSLELSAKLKAGQTDAVVFLDSTDKLHRLLDSLTAINQSPIIVAPAALVTGPLFDIPAAFDNRVYLAYPNLPVDVTEGGRSGYAALAGKFDLPHEHLSGQVASLASAKVLVEGLKRAGRDISRDRLIKEIEGLYRYETGLTPPITFNLNRRIGALGAHIVNVDLASQRYQRVGDWRRLD
jgi:ABC-type branched-subunit amino acid transport system substrate-binding protein